MHAHIVLCKSEIIMLESQRRETTTQKKIVKLQQQRTHQ